MTSSDRTGRQSNTMRMHAIAIFQQDPIVRPENKCREQTVDSLAAAA
jgi:hypothetical protein